MPPKAESSVAPNGEAGAAAGGAAAAEGAASSDDEEEEEGVAANEEEEFVPSKSKICSDLGNVPLEISGARTRLQIICRQTV